jgi:calcineurin-like phosphoesterase family protein
MIWFTSDTHFGHENIIKYCKRPFETIEEMDEVLIRNWNDTVQPTDVVYHLGDFAMTTNPDQYLRRLNGYKHLILGNHDSKNRRNLRNSTNLVDVKDVDLLRLHGKTTIWLSHYAHARWPHAHHGALHLFGHSHGSFEGMGRSMDVGVDPMEYYPISLDDVIRKLEKKEPVEHHGED